MKPPRALTAPEKERARRLLCELQDRVRDAVSAAVRRARIGSLSRVAAVTRADTIFRVDRVAERAVSDWFSSRWPARWPVELVMEGIESTGPATYPRGTPVGSTRFKCIIDPIDGTREIMFDRRSAWTLAALAPQKGARTMLSDLFVAAMTELPTTKQFRSDQFSAIRGGGAKGIVATAQDVRSGARRRIRALPSDSADLRNAFASFVLFFPEGKSYMAGIEEALWNRLYGVEELRRSPIFEDQYLTTGGQLHDLLTGRSRMLADIRPLAASRLGLKRLLPCHPYDLCTALILEEAGGVVESPMGGAADCPLDTTTPVAWVGYANRKLARKVGPVLRRLLKAQLKD